MISTLIELGISLILFAYLMWLMYITRVSENREVGDETIHRNDTDRGQDDST